MSEKMDTIESKLSEKRKLVRVVDYLSYTCIYLGWLIQKEILKWAKQCKNNNGIDG